MYLNTINKFSSKDRVNTEVGVDLVIVNLEVKNRLSIQNPSNLLLKRFHS
jgi:hypothetical protein